LVGIDKSKSAALEIFITDNEIDEVRKLNQIDGKIYPESQFPRSESLLRGFHWREEERPKSIEDLFSDDPPLKLPKIQGLADYVPAEDFFDEELIERVEKAESTEDVKKDAPTKAGRNIPKAKTKTDSINPKKPTLKPVTQKPKKP